MPVDSDPNLFILSHFDAGGFNISAIKAIDVVRLHKNIPEVVLDLASVITYGIYILRSPVSIPFSLVWSLK